MSFVSFLDFFKLFFTDELCSYILKHTNNKLKAYLDTNSIQDAHSKYLYSISMQDLYTFLGIMILIGVFRTHKERISNLYSEDPNLSKPIIKCAMPRDRFKVILRFLRFDDPSTRLERSLLDKLAPIRHVFDSINASLNRSYSPG